MKHKLILVEGIPGAGKTTTARLVQQILTEKGISSKLFLEGDLDHPADFESVAYLSEDEFDNIKTQVQSYRKVGDDYLVPYRKQGLEILSEKDIYELPFEKNRDLIVENWGKFAEAADGVYIFECCFIQNPVTIGMIKHGVSDELVIEYINRLAEQVARLNPLLIYIDQANIEATFLKTVEERAQEWSEGFMSYYTEQGYGKEHGLKGIAGTVEVLEARKKLEGKIIAQLKIPNVVMDNSNYDLNEVTEVLKKVLL